MLSLWQPIPIPVSAPFNFGKRANLVATPQSVRRVGLWLDHCISRASTLGTGSNILATRLPTISTSVTRQRWQRACSYAIPGFLTRNRRGHSLQRAFNLAMRDRSSDDGLSCVHQLCPAISVPNTSAVLLANVLSGSG
jgi:hypothetical protein